MPLPGAHLLMALLGMSEKSRKPPFAFQTGPSVHLKPSPSFSKTASGAISASSAGDFLTIVGVGIWAISMPVIRTAAAAAATQNRRTDPPRT